MKHVLNRYPQNESDLFLNCNCLLTWKDLECVQPYAKIGVRSGRVPTREHGVTR
jgi:hypothetical protein